MDSLMIKPNSEPSDQRSWSEPWNSQDIGPSESAETPAGAPEGTGGVRGNLISPEP